MGVFISRLFAMFTAKTPARILMVGLDAAGKTTLLYRMKLAEVVTTIPTVGFNVETVEYKNISFTVWDVGGQTVIRSLWRHYYTNTNGVIFVVDCNDPHRLKEAAEELHGMLEDEQLSTAALLVFANKQDLPRAATVGEVAEGLRLAGVTQPYYVQASCAVSGSGLVEGLDWLSKQIQKQL
ncbi:uncharacterized protein LOC133483420 isoform X2 [Phyllopteryx taeniolatus]|uniref:uncharacterized protein LOC133483420 isoform X2 n=1 Tax=Phyllopteryx taeniolatus TaxID=161469 RepID=UPI002AD55CFF|nr:uncharacterized protein LOC133483420 isoform X2 [Phyllopteryx taeniolatus]